MGHDDPVRQDRRTQHRISGAWRRAPRHGLRAWMDLKHRGDVGRPGHGGPPRGVGVVLSPRSIRQAGHGTIRSDSPGSHRDTRRTHGRRARGDGCNRLDEGHPARALRRRQHVFALCRHLSRPDACADPGQQLRQANPFARLSMGAGPCRTSILGRSAALSRS